VFIEKYVPLFDLISMLTLCTCEGVGRGDEMQEMLQQSLMEMEFVHRQEELEQIELERALTMSLAIEEERLNRIRAEFKRDDFDDDDQADATAPR
jgi:hypothetical protein